eukprot:COSAG05_NODE_5137_length_1255_cov_1.137543_3_plen_44_part_01
MYPAPGGAWANLVRCYPPLVGGHDLQPASIMTCESIPVNADTFD